MTWTDLCVIIVLLQLTLIVVMLHIYILEWVIYGGIIKDFTEIFNHFKGRKRITAKLKKPC